MRLIDGDALYKALTDVACRNILQSDGSPFDVGRTNGIILARDIIRTQPTIEPKRGRIVWFERENGNPISGYDYDWGWKCSSCGYEHPDTYDDPASPPKNNFCPSCGCCMSSADMGREGEG